MASFGAAAPENASAEDAPIEQGIKQGRIGFDGADKNGRPDGLTIAEAPSESAASNQTPRLQAHVKRAEGADSESLTAVPSTSQLKTRPRAGPIAKVLAAGTAALRTITRGLRFSSSLVTQAVARPKKLLRSAALTAAMLLGLFMTACGGGGSSDWSAGYTTQTQIDMNTAIWIDPGYVNGVLGDSFHHSSYRIEAAQESMLSVSVDGVYSAELDLRVLDWDGREIARSDPFAFSGQGATVSVAVRPGSYFIILRNANEGGTGLPFFLQAWLDPPQPDLYNAIPIGPGTVSGDVGSSQSDVAFRFDSYQDGVLSARVDGVPGAEFELRLFDWTGQEIARSDELATAGWGVGISAAVPAGTYYFVLHNKNDGGIGQPYWMQVSLDPPQPDLYNAIPIDAGSVSAIVGGSQNDTVLRYDPWQDGQLSVYLNGVPWTEFEIRVLDWNGWEIARSDQFTLPGDDAWVSANVLGGGTYYIVVHNRNDGGIGLFSDMQVSFTPY